jgi:hypothetical protein
MTPAEFYATKSPDPEYHGIVFDHPNFDGPVRLVANQFAEVTLGGFVHTPAPITLREPDQTGDATEQLRVAFPRQVVGREFKRKLKLIGASRDPISVVYSKYLDDLMTPAKSWNLYASDAGGITFTADSVQVNATASNPMRRAAGVIYDPSEFTGLELI